MVVHLGELSLRRLALIEPCDPGHKLDEPQRIPRREMAVFPKETFRLGGETTSSVKSLDKFR